MSRLASACLGIALVCGSFASVRAEEAPILAMPKPVDFLHIDYSALEADGFFSVIDIRYERRFGGGQGPAVVLTLRIEQPLNETEANDLLTSLRDVRFVKEVRQTEVEVDSTFFFTPDRLAFALIDDNLLDVGQGIEIHFYLDANRIRSLQQQHATDVVIGQ